MIKSKLNRIKSAALSGVVALTALAAPLTTAVTPSITATAAASDNYAKLLQYSLYFYDANMCGKDVTSKGALSWRSNCHTDDEVPGGFHDAGDHAMFGLPQGFTASTLGWAYYEFSDAFKATGQDEHLKTITDHFCDFFKRSTKLNGDSVSSFLYQKGDGTVDHSYWGPPEQQGSGRKMFWTSNGASEIAAQYAAALAANYVNFGNTEDLKYAKALYKFSKQYNQLAPNDFYGSNSLADDQAWAAGWLAIATGDNSYKNDARSGEVYWVHGWNDSFLGAACISGEVTGDWSAANGYISSKANGSNYMFLDKWGSARLNCSMQMTALIATKHGKGDYKNWAKGQMDYILGNNPANTCFVTGFASNSAKNPHHRAASGYTSYEQFNMNNWNPDGDHMSPYSSFGSNSHTLIGALVGGPCDAGGSYHDNMGDYICNEVAIDYNAGLVGAAAGLYHFYGTGSTDKSIEGVTKIYSGGGSSNTTTTTTTTKDDDGTTTTTTTTKTPSGGDIVLLPEDMDVGTEKGDDGETNNYAEFKPQGAKSATLYYSVNSNDMESAGAFGTWTGEWEQEDFNVSVKNGKVEVTYDIPSNVGQTVKAMVFWPHGNAVEIEKVVLHMDSSSGTTSKTTTSRTTTSSRTTSTTSKTPSGGDVVLLPEDMDVGTEKGDDGETNNYAEFKPQGAKSATLYYSVSSNDMESAGAFGTWTGEWEQEDFNVSVKNGKVEVTYDIPSNVGQTVKAMVFWPHGNAVEIEKVVLHGVGGSSTTTSKTTTTTRTTTSKTTTTSRTTTSKTTTSTTSTKPPVNNREAGDSNCDGTVNLADAILIMQYKSNPNKYKLSTQGAANADVVGNGDGVTNLDALEIQKYRLGLVSFLY